MHNLWLLLLVLHECSPLTIIISQQFLEEPQCQSHVSITWTWKSIFKHWKANAKLLKLNIPIIHLLDLNGPIIPQRTLHQIQLLMRQASGTYIIQPTLTFDNHFVQISTSNLSHTLVLQQLPDYNMSRHPAVCPPAQRTDNIGPHCQVQPTLDCSQHSALFEST